MFWRVTLGHGEFTNSFAFKIEITRWMVQLCNCLICNEKRVGMHCGPHDYPHAGVMWGVGGGSFYTRTYTQTGIEKTQLCLKPLINVTRVCMCWIDLCNAHIKVYLNSFSLYGIWHMRLRPLLCWCEMSHSCAILQACCMFFWKIILSER